MGRLKVANPFTILRFAGEREEQEREREQEQEREVELELEAARQAISTWQAWWLSEASQWMRDLRRGHPLDCRIARTPLPAAPSNALAVVGCDAAHAGSCDVAPLAEAWELCTVNAFSFVAEHRSAPDRLVVVDAEGEVWQFDLRIPHQQSRFAPAFAHTPRPLGAEELGFLAMLRAGEAVDFCGPGGLDPHRFRPALVVHVDVDYRLVVRKVGGRKRMFAVAERRPK
jgi:hypothetical protein